MLDSVNFRTTAASLPGKQSALNLCPRCTGNMILMYSGTIIKCYQCNYERELERPRTSRNGSAKPKTLFTSGTMVVYKYIGNISHLKGLRVRIIFTGKRSRAEQLYVFCPWCQHPMKGFRVGSKTSMAKRVGGIKYRCPDKHTIGIDENMEGWI